MKGTEFETMGCELVSREVEIKLRFITWANKQMIIQLMKMNYAGEEGKVSMKYP